MNYTVGTLAERVWGVLATVVDPEIPAVSIVEMGMVADVAVEGRTAKVTVLPTFTGCPAIPVIKQDVIATLSALEGVDAVEVDFTYEPPWTTERISPEGKKKLEEFGIAPPTGHGPVLITEIGLPPVAVCPYCGSRNTRNDSAFGPTPCRALYYCESCRNPFEQFKPV